MSIKMLRSFLPLFLIVTIVVMAFLSVWQRNEMIQVGYEIEVLQNERKSLQQEERELLVEVENLTAVERIEQIASRQLGMAPPEQKQIVFFTARSEERMRQNVSEKE